ncbi:MAG: hypothetical protein ACK47B_05905 [Armatimonadota bacterium]
MKRLISMGAAAALALGLGAALISGAVQPAQAQYGSRDYYPNLDKKIVPIITVGSSLNIGAAQVAGKKSDVDRVKAVAQLETDYKDVARIKILVPVQSENVVQHIDRVPGVSVTALADYALKK